MLQELVDGWYEDMEPHYGLNMINQKITFPRDDNFSDDELALLPYFVYFHALRVSSRDTLSRESSSAGRVSPTPSEQQQHVRFCTNYNSIVISPREGGVEPGQLMRELLLCIVALCVGGQVSTCCRALLHSFTHCTRTDYIIVTADYNSHALSVTLPKADPIIPLGHLRALYNNNYSHLKPTQPALGGGHLKPTQPALGGAGLSHTWPATQELRKQQTVKGVEPLAGDLGTLSLQRTWGVVGPERSSAWTAIYGYCMGKFTSVLLHPEQRPHSALSLLSGTKRDQLIEDLVWNLRTWPLELVEWRTSNSHRLDIRFNPEQDR